MNDSVERWQANKAVYIRDHVLMALVGAAGACALLWWLGNGDWWVGLIAAPAAIAVRGFYLASEELTHVWELTGTDVRSSQGKQVALSELKAVRAFGSAVQLITERGDKHLMKYLADPSAVRRRIELAGKLGRSGT